MFSLLWNLLCANVEYVLIYVEFSIFPVESIIFNFEIHHCGINLLCLMCKLYILLSKICGINQGLML